MEEFKPGQKVIRIGDDYCGVKRGCIYIVSSQKGLRLFLEGVKSDYDPSLFQLVDVPEDNEISMEFLN